MKGIEVVSLQGRLPLHRNLNLRNVTVRYENAWVFVSPHQKLLRMDIFTYSYVNCTQTLKRCGRPLQAKCFNIIRIFYLIAHMGMLGKNLYVDIRSNFNKTKF
jgi:hypothetical protein